MRLLRWFNKVPTFKSISTLIDFARGQWGPHIRASTLARVGGVFTEWVTGPDGTILVPAASRHNTLTIEGANMIRDLLFEGGTAPAANALYIGYLLDSATPSTALTLASGPTGEAAGNGYSRKNVTAANWASSGNGNANNTAAPITNTASGGTLGGGAVNEAFLCNAASGTTGWVLCYAAQSGGPFTVPNLSSLNTTYSWTIS